MPGFVLCFGVALLATFIATLMPTTLISSTVLALLLGLALHPLARRYDTLRQGIRFTSKKVLRLAIIGMGVTLKFSDLLYIGRFSISVMLFTLLTAFGGGYLLGRLLGLSWKQSALINAGTGICGGSAIAALAPVIEADETAVAWALSATFIFDVLMVILFPLMGRALGMSDVGYGLWTGTAVNDTSSVVAAGFAFSQQAGSYAIIVKLARTLSIVPIALLFSLINARTHAKGPLSVKGIFPWFILVFIAVVALSSLFNLPQAFQHVVATAGRFSMVMALAAIGLSTDGRTMARSATKPMAHGFLISAAVVLVSYAAQVGLGKL